MMEDWLDGWMDRWWKICLMDEWIDDGRLVGWMDELLVGWGKYIILHFNDLALKYNLIFKTP